MHLPFNIRVTRPILQVVSLVRPGRLFRALRDEARRLEAGVQKVVEVLSPGPVSQVYDAVTGSSRRLLWHF